MEYIIYLMEQTPHMGTGEKRRMTVGRALNQGRGKVKRLKIFVGLAKEIKFSTAWFLSYKVLGIREMTMYSFHLFEIINFIKQNMLTHFQA